MTIKPRRQILSGALATGAALAGRVALAKAAPKPEDGEVTPTEDLMREHGVLDRVLLIYEEVSRRIGRSTPVPTQVVPSTADIVSRFIEKYHERLEEEQVFPRLERAHKLTALTAILRQQHVAGRTLTARILESARGSTESVVEPMAAFIRMYRPHAAREDTELFPVFHGLFEEKEFRALGARFEDQEHKMLGSKGFEGVLAEVVQIENSLGINDLGQFTPTGTTAAKAP
jgi:hemerythrin-like domain-containing protein